MMAAGNSHLLAVSPRMVLATNALLFLSGRRQRAARVQEIATALTASCRELQALLATLVERGIVRGDCGPDGTVSLPPQADQLTLADVANATDEWLLSASCAEDEGPHAPGLSQAMSFVREQVMSGLRQIRLSSYAHAARDHALAGE